TFTRADLDTDRSRVIIVNESFAKRYFAGEPPVGRRFDATFMSTPAISEVVGLVADARYDLHKPPAPIIYFLNGPQAPGTLHVRVANQDQVMAVAARVQDEIRAETTLFRVTSMTTQAVMIERTLVRERLLAVLSGFFALVGLVLMTVGLYGVLSYAVIQ